MRVSEGEGETERKRDRDRESTSPDLLGEAPEFDRQTVTKMYSILFYHIYVLRKKEK